ncbi:type II secretion system protein [Pseudomonas sp. SH10-3B]|uniref:type II secretion system protein n=1 Tax=Pseudomonas sp. SH10-3B TaxID=2816049 RepID=UPI001CA6786B|nr:type II secretion system protein [Pseudomonas sp. SH10-3B]MBY8947414.1 type II secretion system protein [Pseudomonas sp. SH10-3B]
MPTGRQAQQGSVFMGMLVTVAVVAVMLMEVGTLWSSVLQRERELELLARGNEIRRAIGLYYAAGNTYPTSLEDLVLDRRQPTIKRYLRRAYADPLTGSADWGVVAGPGETLMGVFSTAQGTPFKQGNFSVINQRFTGQGSYQGWVFLFGPGQNNPATRVAPLGDQPNDDAN